MDSSIPGALDPRDLGVGPKMNLSASQERSLERSERSEEPTEKPGDRKMQRAKRRFNRRIRMAALVFFSLAALIVYTLAFHTVTKSDATGAACGALNRAMSIQEKFVEHLERKSIENVEAGVTSSTTSIPEIHRFFKPTIAEIKRTHC
jgi:hypothetical protein